MTVTILQGDCRDVLKRLPANSIHCCVSSPPYYGLRSYGIGVENGEIGLESSPDEYLAAMVDVYRQVWRVLRDDATCWINIGDSYNNFRTQMGPGQAVHGRDDLRGKPAPDSRKRGWDGLKEKDLLMMPARLALALQADGWWIRSDIVWAKPNPMPESVTDRPTSAHEHVFLLTKSARYYYDADAVREESVSDHPSGNGYASPERLSLDGRGSNEPWQVQSHRNLRNVWTIATAPFPEAHFATFPPALAETCIKAGCPPWGTVLDPFAGAGTTMLVADRLQRHAIGIELNEAYAAMSRARLTADAPLLVEVAD